MPIANINWNGQLYRIDFDRKLTDNEVFDYMQKNYPKQEEKKEVVEETPQEEKIDVKTYAKEYLKPKAEKVLNVGKSIGQGATFGQGSHIAGLGQALGGSVYNLLHKENPFKDVAKDYTEGREEFKKEYKDFEDKNKGLALAGELVGGLGTGLGSGALKGIALAKKPLLSAIGSGAGIGALYGASNTEGKGFDLKQAGIGAGLGAGLGVAGLGGVKAGQKVIGKLGTLGKLYGKGVDNTAKAINPVKELVDEEGKALKGTVSNYIREGQNKTARQFANSKYIQDEALKGDVGIRFEEYGNDAVKELGNVKNIIKQAENNAYKEAGITNDTIIDLSKQDTLRDINTALKEFNDEVSAFANSTKADLSYGMNLYKDFGNLIKDGKDLTFGNLKRITNKLYNDKQKFFKDATKGSGSEEYKLASKLYNIFKELKYKDSKLSKATSKYAELEKAVENLQDKTGINFDKEKNFAAKIFQLARDRADGGVAEKALEDFTRTVEKYADTKGLSGLADKINMAQFAYDVRPTQIDSKFAKDVARGVTGSKTMTGILSELGKKVAFGRNLDAQEFYRILAQRIKSGKIKPEDITAKFTRVKVPFMSDIEANRMIQRNRLLGTQNAGVFGKILQQFYNK